MLTIVVSGEWGDAQHADIEKLLSDTASHINGLLRSPWAGELHVKPSAPNDRTPRTLFRYSKTGPIVIQLTSQDRRWNQYAYQFAHEFCHVLSGYEDLKDNPNNWFHETICELASVFTLRRMAERWPTHPPQYLYFGGYPGAVPFVRESDRWRDYILGSLVEPNIERDLLSMTRVDKPALLKRPFELGAAYSGQILSYNKMLGQLQDAGNTTTLARYLDLLSSAGLLTGLPKYSNQPHRRRGSSPKLNVLNTALMTAGSGYSFDEAQADRTFWGRVVESTVGAHVFNTATSDIHLHYWRDGALEVDFVLQRGFQLIPIEVKSGSKPRPLRGMDAFKAAF